MVRGDQCLVTGGAGFIGSNLVRRLVRDGARVRVLDNLSSGHRENLAGVAADVEFVLGDLRDAAAVRAAGRHSALRVTTGREVIELRPDIDWDKGKTLRWVLEHLHRPASGALTPIYLGDDITDEDAFDAVRDGGVPILVRHHEDGDRATAALFGLDSPAQVSEFTDRLARRLSDDRVK